MGHSHEQLRLQFILQGDSQWYKVGILQIHANSLIFAKILPGFWSKLLFVQTGHFFSSRNGPHLIICPIKNPDLMQGGNPKYHVSSLLPGALQA